MKKVKNGGISIFTLEDPVMRFGWIAYIIGYAIFLGSVITYVSTINLAPFNNKGDPAQCGPGAFIFFDDPSGVVTRI